MSTEPKMTPWFAGWGGGKTGPTCSALTPVCGGRDWPHIPVGYGKETVAIVIMQDGGTKEEMQKHATLIAAAPELLDALVAARSELWRLLDARGIEPKQAREWPEIVRAEEAIAKAYRGAA